MYSSNWSHVEDIYLVAMGYKPKRFENFVLMQQLQLLQ